MEEKLRERLKKIIDPHTGIDIVSMGLIKGIKIKNGKAKIIFTPTTPYCPITAFFQEQIKEAAESVKGIKEATVNIEF